MTVRRGRALRPAVATALAGFGLVLAPLGVVGVTAAEDANSPEDLGTPTSEQLARSVQVWDPSGSVQTWDVSGSVKPLVQETSEGNDTVITLTSDVLFEFGSADIPANANAAITDAIAALPPGVAVAVGGHTDSIGDPAANQILSEQRAATVGSVISAARPDLVLTITGHGDTQPVAANSTGGEDNPAGRAQNRRVEVRYSA